jgi:PAS domain S-box-containing protein
MLNLYTESHRWRSEKELDDNSSDLERLFVSSAIGMALLDTEGRFLSANKAFCATLGYSDEELLSMRCEQLLSSFNQRKQTGSLRSFEKDHPLSWQTEQILHRKDRSLMPARVWVSSLGEAPLENSLSLMIIEDITQQKEAEQELSKRQVEVELLASRLIQAQEAERKRLARELHDDIGQRLSLVASEVALMASQSSDARAVAINHLDSLRDELDSLCSDIHGISHELHSYKLQHLGLKSALKDLCRRFSQANFHVNLDIDDMDEPASKEVSLCLYRVVQEALNNAFRHAHAMVVAVTMTKLCGMYYLTIQDTGIGFDKTVSPNGLGLISMNERLKLVKGELKLDSILGRGTEIWVAIPDANEDAGPAREGRIYSDPRHTGRRCEVA